MPREVASCLSSSSLCFFSKSCRHWFMQFLEQTATTLKMCGGFPQLADSLVNLQHELSKNCNCVLCFLSALSSCCSSLCSSFSNGLCPEHCTQCEMTIRGGLCFLGRVIPFPGLVSEGLGRCPLHEGSTGQISYQQFRGRAKKQLNVSWGFTTESPDPVAKNVNG